MKRIFTLITLAALWFGSAAAPVDPSTARTAATHFLMQKGLIESADTLTLYATRGFVANNGSKVACFYIFNCGTRAFILMGADDRCVPVLGYSANGSFNEDNAPENMLSWIEEYRQSIEAGIRTDAPENPGSLMRWKQLLKGGPVNSPKSDEYLLTTTWEQGSGYNNYCPMMNGKHVVVGCVATAMAQIIRYWRYPSRGFGHTSYGHTVYGVLAVDFDTTDYDYSLMPVKIRRSTPNSQRDMVSRLCYHCGITVKMEYQHAGHTSGSGAQSSRVPNGFKYFGYTETKFLDRTNYNDSMWGDLMRAEIDARRPVYYSGSNNDGGHAFVLDGYNTDSLYHFNWGWGGSSDGFYTLSTMVGFIYSHQVVTNIYPSGWDGHLTTFHISPDGTGNGTSWEQANSNITAATKLAVLNKRELWLKEGVYYGDTTANYAFNFTGAITVYGGFAGNETEASERNADEHPTRLDGRGRQAVLYASHQNNVNTKLTLQNLIIQNGYSAGDACMYLGGSDVQADQLMVQNCRSDSGSAVYLNNSRLRYAVIQNNSTPTVCRVDNAALRQSIVAHNDGNALLMNNGSRVINCNIVANHGTAATLKGKEACLINCIVWNNDTSLRVDSTLADTCIRHCAIEGDSIPADSINIALTHENSGSGPGFASPCTTRGLDENPDTYNWNLTQRSVCIDAGEKLRESLSDGDFYKRVRCRNGKIDIGYIESYYAASIDGTEEASLRLYPNPASGPVTIDNCPAGDIQLLDLYGRTLLRQQHHGNGQVTLDLSALPTGLYLLRCGDTTARIVKQ